jgi:trans-aconitate methyltransferase
MEEDVKNNPHLSYAKHILEKHVKLSDYDSILDYGCRNGATTHYMYLSASKKTSRIIGLDSSTKNIVDARTRQITTLLESAHCTANHSHIGALTKKESFSSSPIEASSLTSSSRVEIKAIEAQSESSCPIDECSFYYRTIVPEETSATESFEHSTSLMQWHIMGPSDRLTFCVDNLVALSYQGNRAQLVTSFDTMHLFRNKDRVIRNMVTVLKDNGTLLMTTHVESMHTKVIFELLNSKIKETPWSQAFQNFNLEAEYSPLTSIEELKELLRKNNFKTISTLTEERYCNSKEQVSSYLEQDFSVFFQFRSLLPEQKKQLCDAIAQEYINHFPAKKGSIDLPESLIVKASRHIYSPFSGSGWRH